jgi:NTE family protein
LYFDGGLYNNFPIDVLYKEFKPDVIIGSSVADKLIAPDEDNVISQIKSMLINRGSIELPSVPSVVIEPVVENIGLLEFKSANNILMIGYLAAKEKMDSIKSLIIRRENPDSLVYKRKKFAAKNGNVIFEKFDIQGLKKQQARYVEKLLSNKNREFDMSVLKPKYFQLAADDKIKQIYPIAKFNPGMKCAFGLIGDWGVRTRGAFWPSRTTQAGTS